MVNLNFTLVVELLLFLIFLRGATVWIIRPALRSLDERKEYIDQNLDRARVDGEIALAQEKRYSQEVARIRRKADSDLRKARQDALDTRASLLTEKRRQTDRAVAVVRENCRLEVQQQQPEIIRYAPDVAEAIRARLALGTENGK